MESFKNGWNKFSELFDRSKEERIVYIIRHSKASRDMEELADFDRPLNKKGINEASNLGRLLKKYGVQPDLIIASSAQRTTQTSELIAKGMKYPVDAIKLQDDLYLADVEKLLTCLKSQPDAYKQIVIVAHNPGISELASLITGANIDEMPTTGMVVVKCRCRKWSELSTNNNILLAYLYPKLMKCFE